MPLDRGPRVSRRTLLLLAVAGLTAGCGVNPTPSSNAPAATGNPTAVPSSGTPPPAAAGSGARRWGMTAEQDAAWTAIETAARREGTLTYYAQSVIPQAQLPRFMELWSKDYPDVKVDIIINQLN